MNSIAHQEVAYQMNGNVIIMRTVLMEVMSLDVAMAIAMKVKLIDTQKI